jgi:hypothetical protein
MAGGGAGALTWTIYVPQDRHRADQRSRRRVLDLASAPVLVSPEAPSTGGSCPTAPGRAMSCAVEIEGYLDALSVVAVVPPGPPRRARAPRAQDDARPTSPSSRTALVRARPTVTAASAGRRRPASGAGRTVPRRVATAAPRIGPGPRPRGPGARPAASAPRERGRDGDRERPPGRGPPGGPPRAPPRPAPPPVDRKPKPKRLRPGKVHRTRCSSRCPRSSGSSPSRS